MDLKRRAEADHTESSKKFKADEVILQRKIHRLMSIYKKLGVEIRRIEDREVSFSDDYNEEEEMKVLRRHRTLSKKRLEIYRYMARKGVLFSEDKKPLTNSFGEKKIVINNTGVERLNELLTDFVNSTHEKEEVLGILGRHRHLSYEDVKVIVEKLRGLNEEKMIPTDPVEYENFITSVALAANRKVKEFLKMKHEDALNELLIIKGGSVIEMEKVLAECQSEIPSVSGCSWDDANLEIVKAVEDYDDDFSKCGITGEEFDTDMPCTSEELDEYQEEMESSTNLSDLDASEFGGSDGAEDTLLILESDDENGENIDDCKSANYNQESEAENIGSKDSEFYPERIIATSKEDGSNLTSNIFNESNTTNNVYMNESHFSGSSKNVNNIGISAASKIGEDVDGDTVQCYPTKVENNAISNVLDNRIFSKKDEFKSLDEAEDLSVISLSSDDSSSSIVYLD